MNSELIIIDGEPVEIRRLPTSSQGQAKEYEIFFPNFERLYGACYQVPVWRELRGAIRTKLAQFRAIESNMNWQASRHIR